MAPVVPQLIKVSGFGVSMDLTPTQSGVLFHFTLQICYVLYKVSRIPSMASSLTLGTFGSWPSLLLWAFML